MSDGIETFFTHIHTFLIHICFDTCLKTIFMPKFFLHTMIALSIPRRRGNLIRMRTIIRSGLFTQVCGRKRAVTVRVHVCRRTFLNRLIRIIIPPETRASRRTGACIAQAGAGRMQRQRVFQHTQKSIRIRAAKRPQPRAGHWS